MAITREETAKYPVLQVYWASRLKALQKKLLIKKLLKLLKKLLIWAGHPADLDCMLA